MPVSAIGRFTAGSPDEASFVRGQAVTFGYYPTYLIPWFGGTLVLAFIAWVMWKLRHVTGPGPSMVLLPSVIAMAVTFLGGANEFIVYLVAAPLETVTVTFLLWRMVRVRNRVLAAVLALGHGFAVTIVNIIVDNWHVDFTSLVDDIALPALVFGVMIAAPIAGPRLLMKGSVTGKRFVTGLGLGFLLSLAALGGWIAMWGFDGAWIALFLFIPGPLVFAVLLKWNQWARDVATGEMFREREPGTAPQH